MKILHVSEVFLAGVGSYLEEVCQAQIDQFGAKNVKLLGPAAELSHISAVPKDCMHGIEMGTRSPMAVLKLMRAARAEISAFAPDIVHVHSSFAGLAVRLPVLLRRLIGRTARRPYRILYCPHGWSFDMQSGRGKTASYALIERLLATASDGILCVSEDERISALGRGLPDRRLHVLRNAVSTPDIALKLALPMKPDRLNLLFLGRMSRQKGIDLLAQVAPSLPGDRLHLHVVGGPLEETIEGALGAGLAGLDHVTLHGWVPRKVALATVAACDAVVMPSRWEGMPMVAAEAMSLGRPLLASDIGPLTEIITDGETGRLYKSDDAAALLACLSSINAQDLTRQGAAARTAFTTLFSTHEMTQGLIRLYRQLQTDGIPRC